MELVERVASDVGEVDLVVEQVLLEFAGLHAGDEDVDAGFDVVIV